MRPFTQPDRKLIRAALDQAGSSGLRVHIGLALPEWGNGDPAEAHSDAFVAGAIAASEHSFDALLADFAGLPAWAGCYLSLGRPELQISFEYTQYMMPNGPGGPAAAALHDAYAAWRRMQ
jgi:hypothetical protein